MRCTEVRNNEACVQRLETMRCTEFRNNEACVQKLETMRPVYRS